MSNAVVFLADGFEEIEALSPVDYLRRAGVEVFTVAVPSATMNDEYIAVSARKIPVITDYNFKEFKDEFPEDLPDLVIVPGGMQGSKNLSENEEVLSFCKKCFEAGKFVSAICAAPAIVLAKTGILKGKNWTCYPGMDSDAAESCGSVDAADELLKGSTHVRNVPFVTDGNLITGRGAGTAEEFSMELVRLLCGDDVYAKIKAATCQR